MHNDEFYLAHSGLSCQLALEAGPPSTVYQRVFRSKCDECRQVKKFSAGVNLQIRML